MAIKNIRAFPFVSTVFVYKRLNSGSKVGLPGQRVVINSVFSLITSGTVNTQAFPGCQGCEVTTSDRGIAFTTLWIPYELAIWPTYT